jgi:hypothetical protein
MASATPNSREIQAAFAEYDRHETISNFKVACIIGMALMPGGLHHRHDPDACRRHSGLCGLP